MCQNYQFTERKTFVLVVQKGDLKWESDRVKVKILNVCLQPVDLAI